MVGCVSVSLAITLVINIENGGQGGRAQNFVLLPWRICTFVDSSALALLELPVRFHIGGVSIFRYVVEWAGHRRGHVVTEAALWLLLS